MTRRSRTILAYRSSPIYFSEQSEYHPPENKNEYTMIPSGYPKLYTRRDADGKRYFVSKVPVPQGMVDISAIQGPKVRQYTDGYLRTRFNKDTPITMRQNYVRKVLSNPRTPAYNRQYLLDFIRRNPDMFEPVEAPKGAFEGLLDRIAHYNGDDPEFGFVKRILRDSGVIQ